MSLVVCALVFVPEVGAALALWLVVAATSGGISQVALAYVRVRSGAAVALPIGQTWLLALALFAAAVATYEAVERSQPGELLSSVAYALAYAAIPLLVAVALVALYVERAEA